MEKSEKVSINASRSELVAIVNLLCVYLAEDIAALRLKFTNKYKAEDFIQILLAECELVRLLPQPETRIAPRMQARTDMSELVIDILANARLLKQYIIEGFPASEVESLLAQATITVNFDKVTKQNWEATDKMLSGMTSFIASNLSVLLNKGSMPKEFTNEVEAQLNDFGDLKAAYGNQNSASQTETEDTENEIVALFERVKGIISDAQAVFYKDKAKREKYTFADLKRQSNPGKKTVGGIRGGFFDAINQRPIVGAVIRTAYFDKSTESDKKGRFELKPLPAGVYTIEIEAPGFEKVVIPDIEVKAGMMRTVKKIGLVRAVEGEGVGM
jgi:Carboxypeptidase regulatory-like domain